MKAGTYFIGDLVFALNKSEWDEVCEVTSKGTRSVYGEFSLSDGREFAIFNCHGEGVFSDQYENTYNIVSGCVGCIKVSDVADADAQLHYGSVCTFENDFNTSGNQLQIQIGNVEISLQKELTYDSI